MLTSLIATVLCLSARDTRAAAPKSIGTLTIASLGDPSAVFSVTAAGQTPVSDGGIGTGKFVVTKFTIVKSVDAVSPKLLEGTAFATKFPSAQIDLIAAKPLRPVAITIVLSNVRVTSDAVSDAGETIDLTFERIEETAHTPDGDVTTCFDLTTYTKC